VRPQATERVIERSESALEAGSDVA